MLPLKPSLHLPVTLYGLIIIILEAEDVLTSRCDNVTCPDLDFPGCRTVIPYGACCPICGMCCSNIVFYFSSH